MLFCFFVLYTHRSAIVFKEYIYDGKRPKGHSYIFILVRDPTTQPDAAAVAETMNSFCSGKFNDTNSDFYGECTNESTLECFAELK